MHVEKTWPKYKDVRVWLVQKYVELTLSLGVCIASNIDCWSIWKVGGGHHLKKAPATTGADRFPDTPFPSAPPPPVPRPLPSNE